MLIRDGYKCKVQELVPEVACLGRLSGHELLPRGRGGSIVNPANILMSCIGHQNWIRSHPEDAHARGLLFHAWEKPDWSRANDPPVEPAAESDEMAALESAADQVF